MSFIDLVPLRSYGPRRELALFYAKFDIDSSGDATAQAGNTGKGFTLTHNSAGNYTLNHPKSKFFTCFIKVNPAAFATGTQSRRINSQDDHDPTGGTLNFVTSVALTGEASDADLDPVDGSEIEIFGFMGW